MAVDAKVVPIDRYLGERKTGVGMKTAGGVNDTGRKISNISFHTYYTPIIQRFQAVFSKNSYFCR